MTGEYQAAISFKGDGTVRLNDGFSATSKTGTGVYEAVLENGMGTAEACILVTPWFPAAATQVPRYASVTLLDDGVTVRISVFDSAGVAVDGATCVLVYRIAV
jgi:hypothetical protein